MKFNVSLHRTMKVTIDAHDHANAVGRAKNMICIQDKCKHEDLHESSVEQVDPEPVCCTPNVVVSNQAVS